MSVCLTLSEGEMMKMPMSRSVAALTACVPQITRYVTCHSSTVTCPRLVAFWRAHQREHEWTGGMIRPYNLST
jgi:hypothetical protein